VSGAESSRFEIRAPLFRRELLARNLAVLPSAENVSRAKSPTGVGAKRLRQKPRTSRSRARRSGAKECFRKRKGTPAPYEGACGCPWPLYSQLRQSPPHALGVVEFVLGRLLRSLRAALFDGNLARPENHLGDQLDASNHLKPRRCETRSPTPPCLSHATADVYLSWKIALPTT
jgi:hypothetical protein